MTLGGQSGSFCSTGLATRFLCRVMKEHLPPPPPGARLLSLLLLLCAAVQPLTAAPERAAAISWQPHLFKTGTGVEVEAELGELELPEDRTAPGGRTIRLAFVRLPTLSPRPGPPLVYLAGGPGTPATDSAQGARWPLFDHLRELGDVILLDQRGTGLSRPNLICRQFWGFPPGEPQGAERLLATVREKGRACAEALRAEGHDPAAYNAREIADDVEALRRALGVPKIRLLALSHGTHLALAVIRRHGERVDRAVLAGLVGPDQILKLPHLVEERLTEVERLTTVIARQSADGAGGDAAGAGSLAADMRTLFARLERQPATITVLEPASQRQVEVTVGKLDLQLATIRALGNLHSLAGLPAAYRQMLGGDFSALAEELLRGKKGWLGRALPYTLICTSGSSEERWRTVETQAQGTLLGRWLDFPFPEICSSWGLPELAPELRSPLRSAVPVLLISGSLDFRTPVENAEEVLAGFPHGRHLLVEGAGHGDDLLIASPAIGEAIHGFLAGDPVAAERIAVSPARLAPPPPPAAPAPRLAGPPPPTAVRPVVETPHGVRVSDPFRWLEDSDSADTRAWIEAQNRYAEATLAALPGRSRLRREVEQFLRLDTFGLPRVAGGRAFFSRRRADEELYVVYERNGAGEDRVLLDPHPWSEDHSRGVSLLDVSADGELVVYGVRQGGEDEVEVRLLDVASGRDLPDRLPKARYFGISLAADKKGFFYSRHSPSGGRVLYHRLGTDPATDRELFGAGYGAGEAVYGNLSDDGRYMVYNVLYGASAARTEVHVQSPPGSGEILTAVDDLDATVYAGVLGDKLVLHTTWEAPNGRVFVADPANPGREGWREIIPEHPQAVIRSVSGAGGRLFVTYVENVHSRLETFDLQGRSLGEVPFPTLGTVSSLRGDWEDEEVYIGFSSFHLPYTTYRFNTRSGRLEVWERVEVPLDSDDFLVRQVWVESKDGTRVPMFLVHRRDLQRDGSKPTLLTGYGGFNSSLTPSFFAEAAIWVRRGGVYAVANVRGGGELGADWHRAAVRNKKRNSFDDFAAAAEWLIKQGYTNADKLAISGHSNGGLLVAAVMARRPHLFRAVVSSHPLTDMLRYHRFLAGRFWIPEYGSPDDPDDFQVLFDYSPYHRLAEGWEYPAALFVTGDHDTRVAPLHARKMTARMQQLATRRRPVLLRHQTHAGHAVEGSLTLRIEDLTDALAFLLWQLGEEF